MKITIKENVNDPNAPHKAYSYEATKIELLAGQHGDVSLTSPRNSNNSTKIELLTGQHEEAADVSEPSSRNSNNSISVANLLNGVEKSHEKGKKLLDSSKIVDEDGEPLVMYHGTPNGEFFKFDKKKIGSTSDSGTFGRGFYFTPMIEEAEHYSNNGRSDGKRPNVMGVFLNIRNPFTISDNQSMDKFNSMYLKYSTNDIFDHEDFEKRLIDAYDEGTNVIRKKGYDGIMTPYDHINHTVAFEPNQIKSATENNGDFSNGNDDIRFSKEKRDIEAVNNRFNEELQKQIDGTLEKGHVYRMGNAGRKLQAGGFPDLPMEMRAKTLIEKSSENYINEHPFDIEDVKDLPKAMNNPIAVFDSKTTAGSKVVLLDMKDKNGVNFIAAVSTNVPKSRYSRDGIGSDDI